MRFSVGFALVACQVLASMGWGAEGGSAREAFAAGTAAFEEGDHLLALSHFQDARDAGLEGPAVHYNIAVSHYRLGNYERADAVFSLIADDYPAMRGLAQYNLGLVALRRGDEAAADEHFRRALENSEDEKIRRLAEQRLRAEPVPEPDRWYRLVATRFGHDDNVRLVSDEVPLGSGQSADSLSTELWALVTGPLSSEAGFRFDGSFYAIRYPDASFFDQNYLRLGLVYQWQWGGWRAQAGPHLSHATLDGDGYEQRGGIGFRLQRDLTSRFTVRARYVHDEIAEGDARFAFVEGDRDWLEVGLDRRAARSRLSFGYAFETNDRGSSIASTRNKLSVGYRHSLGPRWTAEVEGSLRRSRYDDSAAPRDEDLAELSLGLTRIFAQSWEVTGTVSLADNDSPGRFSYERDRFLIGISKIFY